MDSWFQLQTEQGIPATLWALLKNAFKQKEAKTLHP